MIFVLFKEKKRLQVYLPKQKDYENNAEETGPFKLYSHINIFLMMRLHSASPPSNTNHLREHMSMI